MENLRQRMERENRNGSRNLFRERLNIPAPNGEKVTR